jgi:hypothetical protein
LAQLGTPTMGLPIPQVLQEASLTPSSTALVAEPTLVAIEVPQTEEKEEPVATLQLGMGSPPARTPLRRHSDAQTRKSAKRREPPTPSPRATPSPKPKEAKQTQQELQAAAATPPPPSPKPARASRKKSDSQATVLPVTNKNTLREYNLQKAVRDAGGKIVVDDDDELHDQWREEDEDGECQYWSSVGGRLFVLRTWENETADWSCMRCRKVKKRGDAPFEQPRSWELCDGRDHKVWEECVACTPVVLRTKIKNRLVKKKDGPDGG